MQYEERNTKPESNRKYLVQQVEEQSDLCDVTVKVGHWERKFHRCVLVASPFFDHVLKNNFIETQTGLIEIKTGTPATLEIAIMFLYGKRPKLTQDNIEVVLHLAEFLLIPNLKSACISWLMTVNITEENCMDFVQLSSIYDFEIPKCVAYIEGHLSEMLRHIQMVNLTKDSVHMLFSDRKLSYVSMDDKLTFLLRWRDSQPDQRRVYFKELLSTIDFREVSESLPQAIKEDLDLKESIDFEQMLEHRNDGLSTHRVVIMRGKGIEGSFWCLDLEREKWFRLDSPTFDEEWSYRFDEISGIGSANFEIYFVDKGYQQCGILMLNLQSDTIRELKIVDKESGNDIEQIDDFQMQGCTCIVNVNACVKTNKQKSQTSESTDMNNHLQYVTLLADYQLKQTSTLYIGELVDEVLMMSPLLSFTDDEVSQICLNDNFTIAMLFESRKYVSLYDLTDHTFEKIQVETGYRDKLAQSEDGFVIYNAKRCICLGRLTAASSLSTKYQMKVITFPDTDFYEQKLNFCDNTWYHYYRKSYNEKLTFESISHSCLKSVDSIENAAWKQLPLPKEASRCNSDTIKDNLHQICLPKSKLRCDIECPHCKAATRETAFVMRFSPDDDLDDYYYNDSSDDDYYGHSYFDEGYGLYFGDFD